MSQRHRRGIFVEPRQTQPGFFPSRPTLAHHSFVLPVNELSDAYARAGKAVERMVVGYFEKRFIPRTVGMVTFGNEETSEKAPGGYEHANGVDHAGRNRNQQ